QPNLVDHNQISWVTTKSCGSQLNLVAMTSDLSPIEDVWDHLRLDDRTPPPNNLPELYVALVEEWNASEQHHEEC
uniref:Uncharacterized protein n=1 Tax=Oryzias melastigma TaxID=30732 RepID=A0A3B3CLX5_ORYME